jgi:hypothetical protein
MRKNIFLVIVAIAVLSSCKPVIKNFSTAPVPICPCQAVSIAYQVDGAETAVFTVNPASAVRSGTTIPAVESNIDARRTATIELCQSATVTLSATNRHGTEERSVAYNVNVPSAQTAVFTPFCGDGPFGGWIFNPDHNRFPNRGVIQSFLFTSDRAGRLVAGDGTTSFPIPGPGTYEVIPFVGYSIYGGTFFFNASLTTNERCVEGGSVLPDGTVRPPNQTATIVVGCPM